MICQKCKQNQANTHFTVVENGVKNEYDLCSECAARMGTQAISPSAIGKFFYHLFSGDENSQIVCSHCGSSLSDFKESSLLGCEHCYEDLFSEIVPLFRTTQRGVTHTGREPARKAILAAEENARQHVTTEKTEIDRLQEQLDEAVKKEAFEEAAKLRDQIKALKGED